MARSASLRPQFQTVVIFLDDLIGAGVGGTAMPKVEEYEKKAAECRLLAAQTKSSRLKKQLDDMAEVWDRLARQRRQGIVETNPNQT